MTLAKLTLGRLKKRSEFLRLTAKGRKWAAPGLVLQALPNAAGPAGDTPTDSTHGTRLGFTCSRQVGNAVDRNRARRRLREAARQVMPDTARAGHDYVIIGRKSTLHRPFALLIEDLRAALKRVGAASHEPR